MLCCGRDAGAKTIEYSTPAYNGHRLVNLLKAASTVSLLTLLSRVTGLVREQLVAVGFDGNEDLQKFVKDGTLEATAVQGSYQMGNLGVKTLAQVIGGKPVQKFVDTGVVIVTKANIDKPEAKNVLY